MTCVALANGWIIINGGQITERSLAFLDRVG